MAKLAGSVDVTRLSFEVHVNWCGSGHTLHAA
jgi:hypothetical protein